MNRRPQTMQTLMTLLLKAYQTRQHKDPGYILFFTVGIVLALTGLALTYSLANRVEQAQAKASAAGNTGFYAAEAGLNLRAKDIKDEFLNFGYPTGTSPSNWEACTNSSTGDDGTDDFACETFELPAQDGLTAKVPTYVVPPASNSTTGEPEYSTVSITSGEFKGLNASEAKYTVTALAMNQQGQSQLPQALLGLEFNSRLVPMFQFAAFYKDDLEISPGPQMTLNGRVHTNGNLYTGAGELLRVTGQITTVKDFYNKRKDNNSTFACGKVQAANPLNSMVNILLGFNTSCSSTTNAMKKTLAEPLWGDQIKLGIDPVQIPPVSFLDVTGDYYDRADFRVEYKPDNNLPLGERANVEAIRRSSGSAVASSLGASEVRSMFQPVMADGDVCSAQNTAQPERKIATWKLMASVAAPRATNAITNNTATLLSSLTSPTTSMMMWDAAAQFSKDATGQFSKDVLPASYQGSAMTKLRLDANSSSSVVSVDSVTGFANNDIVAVSGVIRRLIAAPAGNNLTLDSNLGTNLSKDTTGVAVIGLRMTTVTAGTQITLHPAKLPLLGWRNGDELRVNTTTGLIIDNINLGTGIVTLRSTTPIPASAAGTNRDVRLASLDSRRVANSIANGLTNCIRPAALQQNNAFRNNREARDMNLLQLSIEGLTLWNRDGMIPDEDKPYVTVLANAGTGSSSLTFSSAADVAAAGFANDQSLKIIPNDATSRPETYRIIGVSGAAVTLDRSLAGAVPAGSLAMIVASNKLFDKAPADTSLTTDLTKPEARSYQALGLAASDRTEGGLVFHLTVNGSTYNNASGNTSPYGFALTRGANLPGPLTIASDQAIYVQGDYNCNVLPLDPATNGLERRSCRPNDTLTAGWEANPDQAATVDRIWQPAAVMADSLNVVSNNCVNSNNLLDCGVGNTQPSALSATIYSAFLSGVDTTNGSSYNGGLENYPRFHENWGGSAGQRLFYRGSFVGLDIPEHVSGRWGNQVYTPPARRWAYEPKFDDPTRLPPLAPRFVYLKQELFVRDFKR
jgi:hypothetical protein